MKSVRVLPRAFAARSIKLRSSGLMRMFSVSRLLGAVVGGLVVGSVVANSQPPVYVQQQPVYVQPQPVYIQQPPPVYYQAPPPGYYYPPQPVPVPRY
jgi:hypothetical protein